jgi:hypothetical protein
MISEDYPEALIMDGYDDCIIGETTPCFIETNL